MWRALYSTSSAIEVSETKSRGTEMLQQTLNSNVATYKLYGCVTRFLQVEAL
jgi:hypothetical protein